MRLFPCGVLLIMLALLRSSKAFINRHAKSLSSIRALAYVRVSKLDGDEKVMQLSRLEKAGWKWQADRQAITKSFVFVDFVDAFGFMTKIALLAEKMNHHPEWFNVYNKVDVLLTTHDCAGFSKLDVQLADRMDRLAVTGDKSSAKST